MISQDPKEWGPPTWVFLDAVMNTIPSEIKDHSELRQDLDQFWAALYLPCAECRIHFREFMEKQPFSAVPNDTTELRAWYQALKDHVYSKKPIPTQTPPQTQPIPTLYTQNAQHAKTMERMRQQRWRTQAMRTGMIGWTSSLSRSANNSLRTASSLSVSNSLSRNTSSGSSKSSGGGGCKTCGGFRVSR